MGTLYIDRKDLYIKLDGNALCFYNNNQREGMVPIKPLKRVVIVGNVVLETPVLHRLSDEDISVIFLSGKRGRFCGMLHGRLHNNAILRVKQYEKSLSSANTNENPPVSSFYKGGMLYPPLEKGGEGGFDTLFHIEFSRDIISRKVTAQAELLRYAMTTRHDLRLPLKTAVDTLEKVINSINNGETIDSIRGYEGGASASYFSAYTRLFPESLRFKNRNRRPPMDPVNAILSLSYTLLHFELVREIEVIGLDPAIGFFHQFEYGRESLACDLVEPYRPEVDRFVWDIFRERKFTDRDFSNEDERPGCYLKKESRKRFYPLYEEWAQVMRPKIVEEVRSLARRIMDGQDPLPE